MSTEPDLYFEPWIGADYGVHPYDLAAAAASGVYPVHVLGESHYGTADERSPGFTRHVVAELGDGTGRTPFFRNLLKTLTAKDHVDGVDAAHAWRNIAFSNYVQDFLPGPRVPPTPGMWDRGARAFTDLLERYRPDCILVLGRRLWNNMTRQGAFTLAPIEQDDVVLDDAVVYEHGVGARKRWTVAAHILHPSAPAFDLRKARLRVALLRRWQDNIDTGGTFMPFGDQRARIAAPA